MGWIQLVHNKYQWRAGGKTEINPAVTKNIREFLE
jgi:hypothetical protein